eukprot:TRINITY_DN2541_c0_g1_i6.p1 TRINITY_DN2541_c0_g1~~TRINITY_DN2541_c0_g1_i6.p1  ORF type:complete len:850 (+),score=59.74 TRINITY_DN2541_c0_g1_i6:130-2679(+)
MITKEQLESLYDVKGAVNLINNKDIQIDRARRKVQYPGVTYSEVILKTEKGIPFNIDSSGELIQGLNKAMNGMFSYFRAQGELVVNLEAICFVPSLDLRARDTIFLDKIIVLEYFGRDLTNDLASKMQWTEEHVDKLLRFLIRCLRMMQQRGIIHGDIKPANIVRDDSFNFKLIDLDDSGFYRSESALSTRGHTLSYSSKTVRTNPQSKVTAEQWRQNDLHCTAVTIIQTIFGLTSQELKMIRETEDDTKEKTFHSFLDSLPSRFPNIGERVRKALLMLFSGENINDIASAYDGKDSLLAIETFAILRNKQSENSIISLAKSVTQNDEIAKIITMLVSNADLGRVAASLSENRKAINENWPVKEFEYWSSCCQPGSLPSLISYCVPEIKTSQSRTSMFISWENSGQEVDDECEEVLDFLCQLECLYELKLVFDNSCIGYSSYKSLASSLGRMKTLLHFEFSAKETYLNDKKICILASALSSLSHLKTLRIDPSENTTISDAGAITLLKSIASIHGLAYLSVSFYKCEDITDAIAHDLATAIGNSTDLTQLHIDLGRTKVTGEGIIIISHSLQRLSKLTDLTLKFYRCQQITERSCTSLASCISSLEKLTRIEFSFKETGIRSYEVEAISNGLSSLKYLTDVHLYFGRNLYLSDSYCSLIVRRLFHLERLDSLTLDFSEYETSGNGTIQEVRRLLHKNDHITRLRLNFADTRADSDEIGELAEDLSQLTLLQTLSLVLDHSFATDETLMKLDESLSECSMLSKIYISCFGCKWITESSIPNISQLEQYGIEIEVILPGEHFKCNSSNPKVNQKFSRDSSFDLSNISSLYDEKFIEDDQDSSSSDPEGYDS